MSGKEFVKTMEGLKNEIGDLQSTIMKALTEALGELPAIAAVSYTGTGEDGDLGSFAKKTEELFGTGSPKILSIIVIVASESVKESSHAGATKAA